MKKEIKVKRDLDLWQYEMPYESMTKKDIRESKKFNVLIVRNYWGTGDYLIGTWNSLISFIIDYLDYDINEGYMTPLYVESK